MKQPTHGPRVRQLLSKLLPPGLVAALAEGPAEAVMHALGQVSFSGWGLGGVQGESCCCCCVCASLSCSLYASRCGVLAGCPLHITECVFVEWSAQA
jgi:hypothetical protein